MLLDPFQVRYVNWDTLTKDSLWSAPVLDSLTALHVMRRLAVGLQGGFIRKHFIQVETVGVFVVLEQVIHQTSRLGLVHSFAVPLHEFQEFIQVLWIDLRRDNMGNHVTYPTQSLGGG